MPRGWFAPLVALGILAEATTACTALRRGEIGLVGLASPEVSELGSSSAELQGLVAGQRDACITISEPDRDSPWTSCTALSQAFDFAFDSSGEITSLGSWREGVSTSRGLSIGDSEAKIWEIYGTPAVKIVNSVFYFFAKSSTCFWVTSVDGRVSGLRMMRTPKSECF